MSSTPFVKICGLSTAADVATALAHGANALGFVLTDSARQVSSELTAQLVAQVPAGVATVGVFRSEPVHQAIELATAANLGWIQLHGTRTPEDIAAIHHAGFKAIRAVRMDAAPAEFEDWGEQWLLIDAAIPGSGESWDYAGVRALAAGRRWLVAGGLNVDNVAAALKASGASGADVSSGVEATRGVKDRELIIRFLAAARSTSEV